MSMISRYSPTGPGLRDSCESGSSSHGKDSTVSLMPKESRDFARLGSSAYTRRRRFGTSGRFTLRLMGACGHAGVENGVDVNPDAGGVTVGRGLAPERDSISSRTVRKGFEGLP